MGVGAQREEGLPARVRAAGLPAHARVRACVCRERERETEDKRGSKRDRETEGETERVLFGAASGRVSLADGCEQRGNKILPVSPAVLMGGEVF